MANVNDERVRALLLGRRAFRVIDFPTNPEIKIAIRVLTEGELDMCRVGGQAAFEAMCVKRKWDPTKVIQIDPHMHARLVDRQILLRAFFDPETITSERPRPFFPGEHDIEEMCDSVVTSDLISAYNEHHDYVSPGRTLNAQEVGDLIEALGKEPSPVVLRSFERPTLESFTLSLVKRLETLQSGRSSIT